jgi:predicted membrane channel-forming protein YqfA (hemolysin III family)
LVLPVAVLVLVLPMALATVALGLVLPVALATAVLVLVLPMALATAVLVLPKALATAVLVLVLVASGLALVLGAEVFLFQIPAPRHNQYPHCSRQRHGNNTLRAITR